MTNDVARTVSAGSCASASESVDDATVGKGADRRADAGGEMIDAATDRDAGTGTPPAVQRGLALVVDDDGTNRVILSGLMRRLGFEVVQATDGHEAVSAVSDCVPDIILMDIMMPRMDGYEATRRIRGIIVDKYVPILFHTAIDDRRLLVRCIEVGGDDFFLKPYDPQLLEAKLVAVQRNIDLHGRLRENRDELARYHARQEADMRVAASIYSTISNRQSEALAQQDVRMHLEPVEAMNGDLVLACTTPNGNRHFLVGDCTGHGLPAALSALKVSDIFYAMSAKGFAIAEIIAELNAKLAMVMPVDRFFAACLMALDHTAEVLTIWNGGMPDAYVQDPEMRIVADVRSQNLPLGIIDNARMDSKVETIPIKPGYSFFACSDGVVEAHSESGEMFGTERLLRVLQAPDSAGDVVTRVRAALAAHTGYRPIHDDVSLLHVVCRPVTEGVTSDDSIPLVINKAPATWSMRSEFDPDAIRFSDPLPTLIHYVTEIQGLQAFRQQIYTILGELFSNAVEHGLLGLDSSIKQEPAGFLKYYERRELGLADLKSGSVRIGFAHQPTGARSGELTIEVSHSGRGFDPEAVFTNLGPSDDARRFSGRGLTLIRALAKSLEYADGGCRARVVYAWSAVG